MVFPGGRVPEGGEASPAPYSFITGHEIVVSFVLQLKQGQLVIQSNQLYTSNSFYCSTYLPILREFFSAIRMDARNQNRC